MLKKVVQEHMQHIGVNDEADLSIFLAHYIDTCDIILVVWTFLYPVQGTISLQ